MKCVVCRQRNVDTGLLCEPCSEELNTSSPIWPEQIELRGVPAGPAALIDVWGVPHHLDAKTAVGRSIEAGNMIKLIVLDPSVSRRHAELELTSEWTLRDLGSTAGTFINEQRIDASPVRHGDRLRFGDIAMFFVDEAPKLRERYDIPTYRLPKDQSGMPEITVSLHQPSGGGGGVAVLDGKRLQLTTPQLELLEMLVLRMRTESNKPADARGFVALTELNRLSLDVSDPGEQHVRQLVFRVRRALINAGVGDLIEVRRNVGYRLRAVPKN